MQACVRRLHRMVSSHHPIHLNHKCTASLLHTRRCYDGWFGELCGVSADAIQLSGMEGCQSHVTPHRQYCQNQRPSILSGCVSSMSSLHMVFFPPLSIMWGGAGCPPSHITSSQKHVRLVIRMGYTELLFLLSSWHASIYSFLFTAPCAMTNHTHTHTHTATLRTCSSLQSYLHFFTHAVATQRIRTSFVSTGMV